MFLSKYGVLFAIARECRKAVKAKANATQRNIKRCVRPSCQRRDASRLNRTESEDDKAFEASPRIGKFSNNKKVAPGIGLLNTASV
jgi:hypothetical protein